MITTRLMGGLGNQMFQYAAGRRLAIRHGVPLRLDLGWFGEEAPGDTPRRYELGCFALDQAVQKERVSLREPRGPIGLAALALYDRFGRRRILRQRGAMTIDTRVLAARDGAHLVGYWQSERYFADIADVLDHDFAPARRLSPAAHALAAAVDSPRSVSVHVRRGDYVSNPAAARWHGNLDAGYYRRALDLVRSRIGDLDVHVFSDDVGWCQGHLELGVEASFVSGLPAFDDLMVMRACTHHVLANSSFSWWGAWLDAEPGAVVVAPERWLADPAEDVAAVFAEGWLRA